MNPAGILTWKKDLDCAYAEVNAATAAVFGYAKAENMLGVKDDNVPCKIAEFAPVFQAEDKKVIKYKQIKQFLELMYCADNQWRLFLVTKQPWIEHHQIQGTTALCLDATEIYHKFIPFILNNSENALNRGKLGLKSAPLTNNHYGNDQLSEQQSKVLFYLLRGKTAKAIADILHISRRTVETHLDQIKIKFNCHKKSELIEKAVHLGFNYYLPEFLFTEQMSLPLT